MTLSLALPLLLAACCCDALNVDYYDQQRRLTRVQYDPTVGAQKVATHTNHDRRLDSSPADWTPFSDQADVTLMVVNPDELYVHVNDTAVTIYGTEITLEDHMWSSERDLVVKGARVHLMSQMKFFPDSSGRQHTVHIHAMEIVVPEGGATIEALGVNGRPANHGLPASGGVTPGAAGDDGADGGAGGAGGVVMIEAMNIYGGVISINVDGGAGAKGQDGGDGAMGSVGARRKDIDDCCKGRNAKGQKGNDGGDGGDGGMGGSGGDGGEAGFVQLLIAEPVEASDSEIINGQHEHVVVSAVPGDAGKPGVAGVPGKGGSGGPGLMTACKRVDWFWFNRMCTFPMAKNGEPGQDGVKLSDGGNGTAGTISHFGPTRVAEQTLQELRAHGNGHSLRYELFLADKLYRNGQVVEAQKIYVWIEAVLHTSHSDEEEGTENLPWRQIGLEASIRLTQLRRGLDFWGHQMNHVPLVSFEALQSTLTHLLRIASKAEEAFESYYSSSTTTAERQSLIVKAAKNLDFEISEKDQAIYELKDAILQMRPEILDLQVEQDAARKLVHDNAAECDGGIAKKAASEAHHFVPNVNRLITMATSSVTAVTEATGLRSVAMGVWSTMTGDITGLVGSLRTQVQDAGLKEILNANVQGVIPAIRTIVTDTVVSPVTSPFQDAWDRISPAINQVEATAKLKHATIEGMREVTNLLLDAKDYMASREKYFDSVEECQPLRGHFESLVRISKNMQFQRTKHDMAVVKFAVLKAERSSLVLERRDLHDSVVGTFDPTSLQFMQSIGEAYRTQKDRIIEQLKLMHEAVDFEFCDQNPFSYEDVRVTQLESFLAQASSERMRKHSEDVAARALLADTVSNDRLNAVSVIELRSGTGDDVMDTAFDNYWNNGTLSFDLAANNQAFPKGVANIRVVSAQAYVPALLKANEGQHDFAEVWMRRHGVSTCSSTAGTERMFSHSSTGYYSVYSATEDPRLHDGPPRWLSRPTHNADTVNPTPFGPWSLSIPALETEDERRDVTAVDIHLVISYVPCSEASCGNDEEAEEESPSQDQPLSEKQPVGIEEESSNMPGMFTAAGLAVFAAGALSSMVIVAGVLQLERRANRLRHSNTLASPQVTTENSDDVELRSSGHA